MSTTSRNGTDELSQSLITRRAADWFVAHRGGGELSASERAQFTTWLKGSPEHVRAYLAVAGVSREVAAAARGLEMGRDELLQQARESGADVLAIHGALRKRDDESAQPSPVAARRLNRYWPAAAAVALGVGLTVLWFMRDGERWGLARTYRTAHAEQGTWRLPDGSVMQLNSDSRVVVQFSDSERRLEVARGQAHFDVTPDAHRGFRVLTGEASIIALGTRFDVYRRSHATVVTVVEGKVAVIGEGKDPRTLMADASAVRAPARVELAAGQRANVDAGSVRPELAPVDIRESTAWLQREIAFEQRALADVAEEFNRYGRVPIRIENPDLAALRISGVFDAYDTEAFVDFIRRLDGVTIQTGGDFIHVRRSSPASQNNSVPDS